MRFATILAVALSLSACRFSLDRGLEPGELRGRVVTEDDTHARAPLAGATVRVEGGSFLARTDAAGRFSLRGLPAATYALRIALDADHDGTPELGLRLAHVRLGADGTAPGLDLGEIVAGGIGSVEVRVRRGGEAVAGAQVAGPGERVVATTDKGAEFLGILPGTHPVRALLPVAGGVLASAPGEVVVRPRERAAVTLDLAAEAIAEAHVHGQAHLAGRTSHGGISVQAVGGAGLPATETNDGGDFDVQVPSGVYGLLFTKPGFSPALVPALVLAGDLTLETTLLAEADGRCGMPEESSDPDADGVPDADEPPGCRCDPAGHLDRDGNGVCDVHEPDADGDLVPDSADDCPAIADPAQADLDGDHLGDACDPDRDGDLVPDASDVCPGTPDPDQLDLDADGAGDLCDSDDDDDAVPDDLDNCPRLANADQKDADHDLVGDACQRRPLCLDGFCLEFAAPTAGNVDAVGARGADDIWLVPDTYHTLHWDGSAWSLFPFPTSTWLEAIWPNGARSAWAAAMNGALFHWDGAVWSPVPGVLGGNSLNRIWGADDTHVWAADGAGRVVFSDGTTTTAVAALGLPVRDLCGSSASDVWLVTNQDVRHATDGTTFAVVSDSGLQPGDQPQSCFASGGEVFVLADANSPVRGMAILHGGPGGWTRTHLPGPNAMTEIDGSGPDDVFAGDWGGAVVHFDGTAWTVLPRPGVHTVTAGFLSSLGRGRVRVYDEGGGLYDWDGARWSIDGGGRQDEIWALAGTPDGHVWAAGYGGTLLHRAPGGLRFDPVASDTLQLLSGVFAAGSDVWAVGDGRGRSIEHGVLVHGGPATPFRVVASPSTSAIRAVHGTSATDVWAVGQDAQLHHFDGATWTSTPSGAPSGLRAVHSPAPGEVWAVGDNGGVVHAQSGTARANALGPMLAAVWSPGPGAHTWAAGSGGAVYDCDPATLACTPTSLDGAMTLNALHGRSASDVWAVGDKGFIAHYDGQGWSPVASGTAQDLRAVFAVAADDVWAAGDAVLHYDGVRWTTTVPFFSRYDDFDAIAFGGSDVWAFGDEGVLAHETNGAWSFAESGIAGSQADAIGFGRDDVWSVGNVVTHYDGARWTTVAMPSPASLRAVHGTSSDNLWAVGSSARFHRTSAGWTDTHGAGDADFFTDVWTPDAQQAFACSPNGVYAWDGTTWAAEALPGATQGCTALAGYATTGPSFEVLALQGARTLLRRTGGTWQTLAAPPNFDMQKIAARSANDVWLVGRDPLTRDQLVYDFDGNVWTRHATPLPYGALGLAIAPDGNVWVTSSYLGLAKLER